ncbi:hypothetical protein, conserved [Leishmania donovani]|uniref:Uncharacterized protein n=1 Tax=Leishmania donovani TaxID=5661 RepID=E9BPB8_LEIDO|nr:hypothetical protein, conserved [Leishmania donovani]TPP43867.1 hypothetical protein CGC21_21330 [Leishmania donovani]CBZ37096.1 hypothetical protein, conserved [Leishmania donovani]
MSAEKPRKIHAKRSFLEPLCAPEPLTPSNDKGKSSASAVKPWAPTSALEWLQLASHLLIASGGNVEAEERVLMVCEEAAKMLLEEDAKIRASAQSKAPTVAEAEAAVYSAKEGGDAPDAVEGSAASDDVVQSVVAAAEEEPPSTERLQAAYLLTAAAVAAAEAHRLPAAESAVRLARAAVEAYRCPMTACTLAMACVRWGMTSCDINSRAAAFQTAFTVITAASRDILERETLPEEDAGYVLRMAWMLVGVGAADNARNQLMVVLQHNPKSYMGLLLLTLLHAAEGDYDDANTAVMHLLNGYPNDVVAIVVHAVVQQKCRLPEPTDGHGRDAAAEELAVAMARIATLGDEAASAATAALKKKSLKGLCTHCAPDEDVEGGPKHSSGELKRRVVGHWALLSHVATRLGCSTVAEVAIEAGTAAVAQSKMLYRRSFADLQCSQARLSLIRLREAIAGQQVHHGGGPSVPLVRDVNLLGTLDFNTAASSELARMVAGLPLTSGVADKVRGSFSLFPGSAMQRLLPSRLFDAVASTLLAAVEACPNHEEGHTLLGVTRLLEASQLDLPSDTRHNRLQEAGRHFMNAMRADAAMPEAYLGAGVVAEAQGATGESFDFYTSAAEVSVQAPLIPWQYFDYLYQ